MSQSGRNLIAQMLARRGLMGGAGAAGEPELRRSLFATPPSQPMSLPEYQREWRRQLEQRRLEDENVPAELLMPTAPLSPEDWVPADQPTAHDQQGYYWKRRL